MDSFGPPRDRRNYRAPALKPSVTHSAGKRIISPRPKSRHRTISTYPPRRAGQGHLLDNNLVSLPALQWLAAGELVDEQEIVERTVWNGQPRGERPGGFAGLGHGDCEA